MKNNWELRLEAKLFANDESDLATLLRDIANAIERGDLSGESKDWLGVYEYQVEEFDPAGEDDIQRTGPK